MGGEGNSEVLGQTVVDWTVVGLNVGRWVSQSSVARRLLSSQTASKLSLAGWRVCFPDKVQLWDETVLEVALSHLQFCQDFHPQGRYLCLRLSSPCFHPWPAPGWGSALSNPYPILLEKNYNVRTNMSLGLGLDLTCPSQSAGAPCTVEPVLVFVMSDVRCPKHRAFCSLIQSITVI